MNIRHIITEAINNVVLKQNAARLSTYLGNRGIDTTPVANNPTAVDYINNLSVFAYQVQDAIESENYEPTNPQMPQQSKLNRAKKDNGVVDYAVDFVTNTADDMYNYTRNAGINFDPIIGGVATATNRGYWAGRNKTSNWGGNGEYQQNPSSQQRLGKTGTDLSTLMGNPYTKILQDYRYVNQSQMNVLSRVPNVARVMKELEDIKNALSTP